MAITVTSERYTIEGGASREILFDALRLADEDRTVLIIFNTGPNTQRGVRMTVSSIGVAPHEDNCWLVTGRLTLGTMYHGFTYAKLQYNANNRSGFIDFMSTDPRLAMYAAV